MLLLKLLLLKATAMFNVIKPYGFMRGHCENYDARRRQTQIVRRGDLLCRRTRFQ